MDLKARQYQVNPEVPFENDLLKREPEIRNITVLLQNVPPPFVLAVNGRWGAGKTTFVNRWAAHLRQEKFLVLNFNAWTTDFSEDPLVAFLGEMNQGLSEYLTKDDKRKEVWEKCKKAGGELVRRSVPVALRLSTGGLLSGNELIRDEAMDALGDAATDAVKAYEKTKSAIDEFKLLLTKVLAEATKTTPLVIFVDELDRCRPTYAIQLLERIKHLFDQAGVVFVLSLDREQLCHAIRAVYGEGLDAAGYLRRFIDVEYVLAKPDTNDYIEQLKESFGLGAYFESREKYESLRWDWEHISKTLSWLAETFNLTLRDVEQLFARVNLVLRATPEDVCVYPALLAFLLVLRDKRPELYQDFTNDRGTLTPALELLRSFLAAPREENFHAAVLEGLLIAAKSGTPEASAAIDHHKAVLNDDSADLENRRHSDVVLNAALRPGGRGRGLPLKDLVQRIEMLKQFNFPQRQEHSPPAQ